MADVQGIRSTLFKNPSDLIVAVSVIVFVMMIIIPLPAFLLDTLM